MASSRAARYWKKLLGYYGTPLSDRYGIKCPEDLVAAVDGHSDQQLDIAFAAIKRTHIKFVPSPGEIIDAFPRKGSRYEQRTAGKLISFVTTNHDLCSHQKALPWSYHGPVDQCTGAPSVTSVIVPACEICERNSLRVRIADKNFEGWETAQAAPA